MPDPWNLPGITVPSRFAIVHGKRRTSRFLSYGMLECRPWTIRLLCITWQFQMFLLFGRFNLTTVLLTFSTSIIILYKVMKGFILARYWSSIELMNINLDRVQYQLANISIFNLILYNHISIIFYNDLLNSFSTLPNDPKLYIWRGWLIWRQGQVCDFLTCYISYNWQKFLSWILLSVKPLI